MRAVTWFAFKVIFSSPEIPLLTWKWQIYAIFPCLRIIRDVGLTPGSDDGWLAFKNIPIPSPYMVKNPQKEKDGFIRRKCHKVPTLKVIEAEYAVFKLGNEGWKFTPSPPFFLLKNPELRNHPENRVWCQSLYTGFGYYPEAKNWKK